MMGVADMVATLPMQLALLLEQAGRASFDDAGLEAAYREDRRERDVQRTRRVLLVLAGLALLLGVIILVVSSRRDLPLSPTWVKLRFGVVIPSLLLSWFLAGRVWGKARLQTLLGWGLPLVLGAYSLEWTFEWTTAMPFRTLWVVPALCFWALQMTLPMSPRAVGQATAGTIAITVTGLIVIVPHLDGLMIISMILAYAVSGYVVVWLARFRERDHREIFVHRREEKLLADRLQEQNAILVRLNRQRDEFVEGVLHDIRSPLTNVFLAADLLQHAPDLPAPVRSGMLEQIMNSAKRVDLFATHFLEQRSLESTTGTPLLTPVPLDPVVESALTRARLVAGAKNQRLLLDTVTPQAVVLADELLLDRALSNLLDNAVKYSPLGATITIRVTADSAGPIRVAVMDTGPGLTAAEQDQLFQPYTRIEKKTTGGEPSTGLGLSLVKRWVEAMGGSIGCESEPDRGATFWLVLQRAPGA